jgi:periplasmic glucans biosynthesis protein
MSFRLPTALIALVTGILVALWIARAPTLPPEEGGANPDGAPGATAPGSLAPGGSSGSTAARSTAASWEVDPASLAADLMEIARNLARSEYRPPDAAVPPALLGLDFDGYRQIRFRPEQAIWRGVSDYHLQLFHLGSLYDRPVSVHLVEDDSVRRLAYDPALFAFEGSAASLARLDPGTVPGFAGFRIHYPLNDPDTQDEVAAFLGASYFRVLGEGQEYGLSARGLAVDPAVEGTEEFPDFRAFWIERPDQAGAPLVIHALLDGPSVSGAFRFELAPGDPTEVLVDARVFARHDVGKLGVAPLSSMFLHAPGHGPPHDDFRPRVHDSDGLQMRTGEGEWIWRPLGNGPGLHVTSLRDENPAGFGLLQRARDFEDYLDLEARYHRRPGYWIEVLDGDWGGGGVELLEIPSESEFNDNVAAYWVADRPFREGERRSYRYRLLTVAAVPPEMDVARVVRTLVSWDALPGEADAPPRSRRRFVIDFHGGRLSDPGVADDLRVDLSVSRGSVEEVMIAPLPGNSGRRVTFALDPQGDAPADMRLNLLAGDEPVSETWSYVWYPGRID